MITHLSICEIIFRGGVRLNGGSGDFLKTDSFMKNGFGGASDYLWASSDTMNTRTLQINMIVTQVCDFTFDAFCEMDDVKNLTNEHKEKAWEKLVKTSKRNIITIDSGRDEEVEWNDVEEDLELLVVEAIEE